VSNNPGNTGNLLEFIVLLEFLEFCKISWKFIAYLLKYCINIIASLWVNSLIMISGVTLLSVYITE